VPTINCAAENDGVREFLADYRRRRTASLVERLERAVSDGEWRPDMDVQVLGVSRKRLLATVAIAMLAIRPLIMTLPGSIGPDVSLFPSE
jgi:hypothetical protein